MLVVPQDWLVREADKGAPLNMASLPFRIAEVGVIRPLRFSRCGEGTQPASA